ncbi:hypothetical protein ABW20_dc0110481 [Dactylellina cionopaga]|nr:hypothetical protein ABW20_dc0110481 [Dactylellina cionopaga]
MSTGDRDSLRVDIKRVVDSAADLSLSLGKQRAMFELEPKRYIGHSYDPKIMDSVGPWAAESDDDQPGPGKPAEILAVIIPALYKFGNDDGDEFDKFRVVRHPEVLVLPVKGIEGSLANNDSSTPASVNTEEPPTTTESAPVHVTEEGTTGAASAEPSQVGQEVSKDEPPPPPPKEELSTEPKCLVEELEAHKARLGEPKAIRVPKSRHSTSGSSKTGKS